MLTLVNATAEQMPIVQDIAHRTWPTTFAGILTPDQIAYMLDWMYNVPTLTQQVSEQGHHFILVEEEGEYLGYAGFEHHFEGQSRTKLHKIYLLPSAQGKGAGKLLIDEVVKRTQDSGDDSLFLHVNRENKAVLFYEKIGFNTIQVLDVPIGNGYFMNDFVMQLDLGSLLS